MFAKKIEKPNGCYTFIGAHWPGIGGLGDWLKANGKDLAGKTVVMILHDFEQVLQFADRVLLMEKGQISMAGEAVEVLSSREISQVYNVKTFLYETEDGLHCYVKM